MFKRDTEGILDARKLGRAKRNTNIKIKENKKKEGRRETCNRVRNIRGGAHTRERNETDTTNTGAAYSPVL